MLSRRKFLKRAGISLLGASVASKIIANPEQKSNAYESLCIRIRGTIKTKSERLEGVVISDGNSVTKSNTNGEFELYSDFSRDFVFISLPSGYKIPQNKTGTAKFYQPITSNVNNEMNIEFYLEKSDISDNEHSFLLLADPQTRDEEDLSVMFRETVPDVKKTLININSENVFGVACGDIMYDRLEHYPKYEEAVNKMGIPFFQVLGNHDLDLLANTDEESAITFKKHFGPSYYSFNKGEIHYVILDDVFWLGNSYVGYIDDIQLKWLERDLQLVSKGSTVVLFAHIPVYCKIHERHDVATPKRSVVVSNRQKLYSLLKPFKSYLLHGHTHESEYLEDGNSEIHIGGAVCGAWWTGPICREGTPKGYTVYSVKGSDLTWQYKSYGKDFSHQLRIYPKGYHKNYKNAILANVWSADKNWKVTWMEDGIDKGEMKRIIDFDPWAYELYEGVELPQKHTWVEPYKTDHLFIAEPSKNAKQVTVKAVDRWGNTYEETYNL